MTHDSATTQGGLGAHARALLDTNRFLTLATVDSDGRPWTSPVYFAAAGLREFYWASMTDARHSQNLAEHPRVSLVVFDSTVQPYYGRAVYATGEAYQVSEDEVDGALEIYPGPDDRGATRPDREDVIAPTPYRLYRATALELWVLCPREPKHPCPLHGRATDHRARVAL